jgi:hypothetical protein
MLRAPELATPKTTRSFPPCQALSTITASRRRAAAGSGRAARGVSRGDLGLWVAERHDILLADGAGRRRLTVDEVAGDCLVGTGGEEQGRVTPAVHRQQR